MEKLCPTCNGKGSIDDPTINGSICYNGPNGETCPQVICRSCGGFGWIVEQQSVAITNPFIVDSWNKINQQK